MNRAVAEPSLYPLPRPRQDAWVVPRLLSDRAVKPQAALFDELMTRHGPSRHILSNLVLQTSSYPIGLIIR